MRKKIVEKNRLYKKNKDYLFDLKVTIIYHIEQTNRNLIILTQNQIIEST